MGSQSADEDMITASSKLLMQVRYAESTAELEGKIAHWNMEALQGQLRGDQAKKTFWINIYNAYFQILVQRGMTKPAIFKQKCIDIAGVAFSLDDIEHGILRRYRSKYSLGYLPQLFPGRLIRRLSVDSIDYRIHFALNCGAKSCPPIAFYDVDKLDAQLDIARDGFLQAETELDEAGQILRVTALFQWFQADFGGRRGVRAILGKVFGRDFGGWKIVYLPYDWSAQLNHFTP